MKTIQALTKQLVKDVAGGKYHCQLCQVTCTGAGAFQAHIQGSKHLARSQGRNPKKKGGGMADMGFGPGVDPKKFRNGPGGFAGERMRMYAIEANVHPTQAKVKMTRAVRTLRN